MEINEQEIIQSIQQGNLEQFALLYDAYVKKIYNFLYFRLHHRETAEDLTSVTFTKALEKIDTYKGSSGYFSSWLYSIARNTLIDYYRTSKTTDDLEAAFNLAGKHNVEREVAAVMQMEKVKEFLKQLPQQQRDIVIMRVWDGLSHREIAEILEISEDNSKVTFSRVIAKLNKQQAFAVALMMIVSRF